MKKLIFLGFLVFSMLSTVAFAAVNATPIKRSDVLDRINADYTGNESLSWLTLDVLDLVITEKGRVEGTNSIILAAKARARGYGTVHHLITMA